MTVEMREKDGRGREGRGEVKEIGNVVVLVERCPEDDT